MKTVPSSVDLAVERYRSAIGRSVTELTTPALLVDRGILVRNIRSMARRLGGPPRLRPHAKTHKSIEIAAMQIEAGAVGITTQTVWEASALVSRGIEDVLVANEVVGVDKIERVATLATAAKVTVAADNDASLVQLARAAKRSGAEVGVLIDVDVGMERGGVRSEEQAVSLAERASTLPGLAFRGVMGYEGHCVLERDRTVREEKARAAVSRLLEAADAIRSTGIPVEVVSAGGTGTFDITGVDPRITELQAGSYVFMDGPYREVVPDFDVSLTVLGTVVSRHDRTAVVDCGLKTVAADLGLPRLLDVDGISTRYVAEEHSVFDVDDSRSLEVGDRVRLVTGHCCGTVNLHDVHHVVEAGVVVDVWPVLARGPGIGTAE